MRYIDEAVITCKLLISCICIHEVGNNLSDPPLVLRFRRQKVLVAVYQSKIICKAHASGAGSSYFVITWLTSPTILSCP